MVMWPCLRDILLVTCLRGYVCWWTAAQRNKFRCTEASLIIYNFRRSRAAAGRERVGTLAGLELVTGHGVEARNKRIIILHRRYSEEGECLSLPCFA